MTKHADIDRFYLNEALKESTRSDDPKARRVASSGVGAIIVGAEGEVSRSANVVPSSAKKRLLSESEEMAAADRYHLIEHAERAAIYKALLAGKNLEGSTLYCTRFPCSDCARAIVWAGIGRMVVGAGFGEEKRWLDSQRAALRLLRAGGVVVRYLLDKPGPENAGHNKNRA